jgi:hypothetical protein
MWKLGLVGLWLVAACGGISQQRGDVTDGAAGAAGRGNTGGAGGMGVGGTSTLSPSNACEVACVREIFQSNPTMCKLCHNKIGLESSGLDFASDGFTARLKDVPARHAELAQGMSARDCPIGDKLIDSVTPDDSWLLKKIRGLQGKCGSSMPAAGMLSLGERACLENYVYCVAAQ